MSASLWLEVSPTVAVAATPLRQGGTLYYIPVSAKLPPTKVEARSGQPEG